jgi:hypothetical protein
MLWQTGVGSVSNIYESHKKSTIANQEQKISPRLLLEFLEQLLAYLKKINLTTSLSIILKFWAKVCRITKGAQTFFT